MSFSLVPDHSFRNLLDISPDFLSRHGIKFLMIDLDNTIAAYNELFPSSTQKNWIQDIKNSGVEMFLISNSSRTNRVESFAKALDLGFILNASKPSPRSVYKAMDTAGYNTCESALAGDQIFTDTLAANRAGVVSVIVRPRRFTNIFLALRYYIEIPVRVMCKNKNQGIRK